LLASFKAVDEFYNLGRPTRKKYRQLCTSVSAADLVLADDFHLAQLSRRTIGY
jgi:hypothetical protein